MPAVGEHNRIRPWSWSAGPAFELRAIAGARDDRRGVANADAIARRWVRAVALNDHRQVELAECLDVAAIGLRLGHF